MASWVIAKDMAKINEENLSKLSRKDMYARMKGYKYTTKRKIYTFKKASPEILKSIRLKRQAENQLAKRKRIIIGSACVFLSVVLFWMAMTL